MGLELLFLLIVAISAHELSDEAPAITMVESIEFVDRNATILITDPTNNDTASYSVLVEPHPPILKPNTTLVVRSKAGYIIRDLSKK